MAATSPLPKRFSSVFAQRGRTFCFLTPFSQKWEFNRARPTLYSPVGFQWVGTNSLFSLAATAGWGVLICSLRVSAELLVFPAHLTHRSVQTLIMSFVRCTVAVSPLCFYLQLLWKLLCFVTSSKLFWNGDADRKDVGSAYHGWFFHCVHDFRPQGEAQRGRCWGRRPAEPLCFLSVG